VYPENRLGCGLSIRNAVKPPTLFRALLWRELIILIGCLVMIYFVSTWVFGTFINRRWQLDLQGEADWTATLLASMPEMPPLAADWRRAHPETRLMLQDGRGTLLLDTNSEWNSRIARDQDAPLLAARSQITGPARTGEVILSRYGLLRHPWHNEFILLLVGFSGICGRRAVSPGAQPHP
jgi:hypothetical protein